MSEPTANPPRTVLVTGGGGFLGSCIVRQLLERGCQVRSFSRSAQPQNEALGVQVVRGDLTNTADVSRAAEGCDAVFHVAAKAGIWGSYDSFYRPNVLGTRNVLAACKEHGIGFLVHTSTPSVVFSGAAFEGAGESLPLQPHNPISPYAATKAIAEQEVLAAGAVAGTAGAGSTLGNAASELSGAASLTAAGAGLRVCALRPHLIYGPGDPHLLPRLLERARAGRLRRVGSGENYVDLTHVKNAARAHLLALDALQRADGQAAGKAYFISDGAPVNLWQWIDAYLQREGVRPIRSGLSASAAWRIGAVCEWLWRTFPLRGEPPMTRFVATELAKSHWFDISAARRDLGYDPQPHPY